MRPAEREKDLLSKQELCLGNCSNPGAGDGADISLLADGRAAWISSSCIAAAERRLLMLCWGPEEDWAGIWGGACLGMLHNIHLRGRYLLKFQLLRDRAEAEWGLAFALQRGAIFLPQASVSDQSQCKKAAKPSNSSLTARQTRQGQVGAVAGLAYISSSYRRV